MTGGLCEVRLIDFPLALHVQAEEHHNELIREFALISLRVQQHDPAIPVRLLQLIDQLTQDFGDAATEAHLKRDAALAAGLESVDLIYHVPPNAAEASHALRAMLDEADDFCRSGSALLTLATPPEARAFRNWYLQEFGAQLSGVPPTPWPDYQAAQAAKVE